MFGLLRLTRKFLLFCLIATIAIGAACVVMAGRLIVDPGATRDVEPADAIFVLAGSNADRWLEGYELWREKRAPLILLSPGFRDAGERELQRRGLHMPTGADVARDVLVEQMGVPPEAVEVAATPVDNTAAEATTLAEIATARGWRHVVVVTSLAHTRRTRFAMERALDGTGITVQVRGSRFDRFDPWGWWQRRGSARWVLSELPKLLAYKLGLED